MKEIDLIKRLKSVLAQARYSPEQFSHLVNCSSREVRRWMSGEYVPSPLYRAAILRAIRKIERILAAEAGGEKP